MADGEMQITSRTLDDKKWTVAFVMDDGPVQFYLYDRGRSEEGDVPVHQPRRLGEAAAGEDAPAWSSRPATG